MSVKIKENNTIKPLAGNANISEAIVVDAALSTTSNNAVQNKAVKAGIDAITVNLANTIDTSTMLPNSTPIVPSAEASAISDTITTLNTAATTLNSQYSATNKIKLAFDSNAFNSNGVIKGALFRNTNGLLRGANAPDEWVIRDATVHDNLFYTVLNDNEVLWIDRHGDNIPDEANHKSRWYHDSLDHLVVVLKAANEKQRYYGSALKIGDEIQIFVRTSNYGLKFGPREATTFYTGTIIERPLAFDINGNVYRTTYVPPCCNTDWVDEGDKYAPEYNQFGFRDTVNNYWTVPMWLANRPQSGSQTIPAGMLDYYRDPTETISGSLDPLTSYGSLPPLGDTYTRSGNTYHLVPAPLFTRYTLLRFVWNGEVLVPKDRDLIGQYVILGNEIYNGWNAKESSNGNFGVDMPTVNSNWCWNGVNNSTSDSNKCITLGYLNVYTDNTAECVVNCPTLYHSLEYGYDMTPNSNISTIRFFDPIFAPAYKFTTEWAIDTSVRNKDGISCTYGVKDTTLTNSSSANGLHLNTGTGWWQVSFAKDKAYGIRMLTKYKWGIYSND